MNSDLNLEYYAHAFVVIESIWPDTKGLDIGGIYDADGKLDEGAAQKHGPRSEFLRKYVQLGSDHPDAIYRGYYLLMPLNIKNITTNTAANNGSVSGDFSVTLSLDDIVLVTEKNMSKPFLGSSGYIVKASDIVPDAHHNELSGDNFKFYDYLRMSKGGKGTVTGVEYVNYDNLEKQHGAVTGDSTLQFARYRINGAQSMFSIDDLVSPMDTVTIWLYHDPQDFAMTDFNYVQSKEGYAKIAGASGFGEDAKGDLYRKFHHIIGSGNRRRQFTVDRYKEGAQFLEDSGLINKYSEEALKSVQNGSDGSFAINQQTVKDAAISIVGAASTFDKNKSTTGRDAIVDYETAAKTSDVIQRTEISTKLNDKSDKVIGYYLSEVLPEFNGAYVVNTGSGSGSDSGMGVKTSNAPASMGVGEDSSATTSGIQIGDASKAKKMDDITYFIKGVYSNREAISKIDMNRPDASKLKALGITDVDRFVAGYNKLKEKLEISSKGYISRIKGQSFWADGVGKKTPNAPVYRKALATKDHCETPYLAMKGHITDISTDIKPTSGFTVTLRGASMDYPLDKTTTFYDDNAFPSASQLDGVADMVTVYIGMSPAKMMLHLIWKWAPNVVRFGKPSQASAVTRSLIQTQMGKDTKVVTNGYAILPLGKLTDAAASTGNIYNSSVVFTPINFIDLHRISENLRVYDKADPTGQLGILNMPQHLQPNVSVLANARQMGGAGNLMEFWTDESGKIIYRMTFEAWERTPEPQFTPTITDFDMVSANFSRGDGELNTVYDVLPEGLYYMGADTNSYNFTARSTPRPTTVPIAAEESGGTKYLDLIHKTATSASLYRYGMRYLSVSDMYSAAIASAVPKSNALQRFFGQPIKKGSITVQNNTSFRAGHTVLVELQKVPARSNVAIDIKKMLDWLEVMKTNGDLRNMFIGFDERLKVIHDGGINIHNTSLNDILVYGQKDKFFEAPKMKITESFISTFKWLAANLPKDNGPDKKGDEDISNIITSEYFPTTLWYYLKPDGSGPNNNTFLGDINPLTGKRDAIPAKDIVMLHKYCLRLALQLGTTKDLNALRDLLNKYPSIVNSMDFINYTLRSYYIASVSHSYDYDGQATTALNLNHGQDNICIRDPKSGIILGFMSVERKFREGYVDMQETRSGKKDMEKEEIGAEYKAIYREQFLEDQRYKKASFMYQATKYRTASNYYLKLAKLLGTGDAEIITGAIDQL